MNKNLLLSILLFTALGSKAQMATQNSFGQGQKDLNIGLGLGSNFYRSAQSSLPVIGASFDYGITNEISLGMYLGITGATYNYYGTIACNNSLYNYEETYKWSFMLIGFRGAYHFQKFIVNTKVDLYAGLTIGYDQARFKYSSNSPCLINGIYGSSRSKAFFSGFAGCRYRFNDHFGAFGELGYGISYLTLGLNYRF